MNNFFSGKEKSEQKRKSIIVQFSVQMGIFIMILFIALGILSYQLVEKSSVQSFSDTMSNTIPVYASSIDSWNQQLIREMHTYTNLDYIADDDTAGAVNWIRDNKDKRHSDFSSIFFCDMDKTAYSDTGQDINLPDQDNDVIAILKEGKDIFISDPIQSMVDDSYVYEIAAAAYDRNHKKIGFFGGIVSLSTLQEFSRSVKVGKNGYLSIFDGTGICIAHPDAAQIMTNMNNSTDEGKRTIVKRMMNRESGTGRFSDGSYAFYGPVKNTTWSVTAVLPASEINATADTLTKTMAVLFMLSIIILTTITALTVRRILNPLKNVQKTITDIASGKADLSRRLDNTKNDEIGSVVHGFNTFIEKMQNIMTVMKKSKDELASGGDMLRSGVEDTSAAITQILSDIDGVKSEIVTQSAGVEETAGALSEISQNIVSLEKMIENHASGITEASAAVEEMIGNIGSVNKTVEQMAHSFSALETRSNDGMTKQNRVFEQIKQISSQSQMLEDANAAIASIAGQTNLLSMNAAIEAAHAGDAGKGFSVVADEIRKLAETSSAESRKIKEELKKIQGSIGTVVSSSADTARTFNLVSESIEQTNMLVTQIKGAMEEQLTGSKQIGESLQLMNDSTAEVRNASTEMSAGQKTILDDMKKLQNATASMKEKVNEMETGAKKIGETGSALGSITKRAGDAIELIGGQIDQFTV
jgi:methyl-accepting chemotaxis protein